jgi:tetratricopeptide (TPR) repeat protein
MGAISFVVFGASFLGGFAFLQSHNETTKLHDNAEKIVKEITTNANTANELVKEFQRRLDLLHLRFEKVFPVFNFSGLDEVIGPLLVREGKVLQPEDNARIEDYDVQIQVGELFGTNIDPNIYTNIYVKLGRFYAYKGRYEKALIRFNDALQKKPDNLEPLISKIFCLGKIAEGDISSPRGRDLIKMAYESLGKAQSFTKDQEQSFQFHFAEAWLTLKEGHYKEAIKIFEEAKKYKPYPYIDYNIACCLSKLGDLEGAIQMLETLKTYPNVLYEADQDPDLKPLVDNPTYRPRLMALVVRGEATI